MAVIQMNPCKGHVANFVFGVISVIIVCFLLLHRLRNKGIPKKPAEITCFLGVLTSLCYFISIVIYYGPSVSSNDLELLPSTLICSASRNLKHETSVIVMAIFIWWSRQRVIVSRILDEGGALARHTLVDIITFTSIANLLITPIIAETMYAQGSDYWKFSDENSCGYCETKEILLTPGYIACSVAVGLGALVSVVGFQLYFTYNIIKARRLTGNLEKYSSQPKDSLGKLTRRNQNLSLLIAFQTTVGMSLFALPAPYASFAEEIVFLLFALAFFYEQFMTDTRANNPDRKIESAKTELKLPKSSGITTTSFSSKSFETIMADTIVK